MLKLDTNYGFHELFLKSWHRNLLYFLNPIISQENQHNCGLLIGIWNCVSCSYNIFTNDYAIFVLKTQHDLCGQIQQHTMTDCINGSNLSKNENKQIKALPPYIIQSLLVSTNKSKHVADDRRPKNAMFASFVNMCAILKITIVIMKSSILCSPIPTNMLKQSSKMVGLVDIMFCC